MQTTAARSLLMGLLSPWASMAQAQTTPTLIQTNTSCALKIHHPEFDSGGDKQVYTADATSGCCVQRSMKIVASAARVAAESAEVGTEGITQIERSIF